jgi:Protein of unknown function (DUF2490)
MRSHRTFGTVGAVLVILVTPCVAAAQTELQLWGNVTFSWIKDHRLTLGVDTEPQVLVSKPADDPGWATLDVTPSVEYTPSRWFDVLGQLKLGRTRQTNDLDSTEIAPRVGVQFHVLTNVFDELARENRPKHRFVMRDLLRLEWRNFYYSTDQPDSSTRRLRNRVQALYPLNRSSITDQGAIFLLSDVEWFWPRNDPDERFANQQRIRAGVGYRRDRAWRFETLYVWDRSRDSVSEGFATANHAIDLRVRRVW